MSSKSGVRFCSFPGRQHLVWVIAWVTLIHKGCVKAHPGGQLKKPGRWTNLESILSTKILETGTGTSMGDHFLQSCYFIWTCFLKKIEALAIVL